jgi:uncharacterized RDD family membrane protein YckC
MKERPALAFGLLTGVFSRAGESAVALKGGNAMIRTKTVVARSREDVWDWLMEPAHWKLWDQGDLLEVTPGWQVGATLKWAIGLPSKLSAFREGSVLGIESQYLLSTFGLIAVRPGETEVEIIEVPLRGAAFSGAGEARIAQLDKSLRELKRLLEGGAVFLSPLTAEEKLAVGNLPLEVYESVIREKTPGLPDLVIPSPGPDAFARLQGQQEILRKLGTGDIRRLKESVAQVMEADLVARGAKPEGPVIVAKGGNAQDLVRGAELYALAARWNPYNALALMSCGVALAKAGWLREALPWLERAGEVDPGNERIKNNIEAVRADVAKSMRSRTAPQDLHRGLPDSVRAEAIPAFDLVWPPVRRSAPETSESRRAPQPQRPATTSYASPVARLAAGLIDWVILLLPTAPLQMLAVSGGSGSSHPAMKPGWALMALAVWWLYFAALESSASGATIGKRLLGLRVVDLDGRRIGFGRASWRFFGKLLGILTFYIGYAMAVFTPKKQALHDLMAKTLVVKSS